MPGRPIHPKAYLVPTLFAPSHSSNPFEHLFGDPYTPYLEQSLEHAHDDSVAADKEEESRWRKV